MTVGELSEHAGEVPHAREATRRTSKTWSSQLYWISPDEPLGHGESESMVSSERLGNSTPLASPSTRIAVELGADTARRASLRGFGGFKGHARTAPTTKYVWKVEQKCGRRVRQEVPGEIVVKVRRKSAKPHADVVSR